MFLQEVKLSARQVSRLKYQLGFERCLGVDNEEMNGGLALMWREDIELHILNDSKHHVHASIVNSYQQKWFLTGVYGHPGTHKRIETWDLIKSLCNSIIGLWQ